MSKWMIPRHKPRNSTEDMMCDKNHGKRFKRKELSRRAKESRRKEEEYRNYKGLADGGVEVAKLVLGSCNRKKSLPLKYAKKCAASIFLETGRRVFVYECPYCGLYHITSHPENGGKYVYSTDDFTRGRR